jgi:hypothetical protein
MLADLRKELQKLRDEDAPASVQVAAEEAVRCVELGLTPPAYLGHTLMTYAAQRSTQDRYGK